MLQFSKWQIGLIAALIALGAYLTVPNFFSEENKPWGFPDTRITLGLDLQGGSYLLLAVDTEKVISDRLGNMRSDIRTALRGRVADGLARITVVAPPALSGDSITVEIRNPGDSAEAESRLRDLIQPVGGIGSVARSASFDKINDTTFSLTMTAEARTYYADNAVTDSIEAVRERIDSLGTTEPYIQRQGRDRLVVQVPGDEDSERLKNIINAEGQLSFHMVDGSISAQEAATYLPPNRKVLPSDGGFELVIVESAEVTGDKITDASSSPNNDGSGFQVNVAFDRDGQRRFFEATRNNVGQLFAIVLDENIISAPRINEPINSPQMRITGSFTAQQAADLALLIRAGALPAPLQTIEQRTVGAGLGADSVRAGTQALIIGFIAVVVFMAITYGRFGLYADIALIANVLLIAGALSLLGATLTLPGIAGIVLTIGMAVDANVLIFERIREEIKAGKGAVAAVQTGYEKAFSAIIDANVTTLLAAGIMFFMGSGPVRGFAVTLGIGVISSVFTAYVVTRLFTGGYVLNKRPKDFSF